MERLSGILLIIISAISFGWLPIFARFAYADGVDPVTVLFFRFLIASVFMVVSMVIRKTPFPRGTALVGLVIMGGAGYVGQSLCYFTALTLIPAGLVAFLLYLYPVLVTVLSALVLHQRVSRMTLVALLLAMAGLTLALGVGRGGNPAGIALGLLAAVIYSFYILTGSRIVARGQSIAASSVVMMSAAVVYGLIAGVRGLHLPATWSGWGAILAIAGISTVLAIVTFFAGLERIGPTDASTISTLEPVVTVGLAALFLGELLLVPHFLGGAMILIAVVILSRQKLFGQSVPSTERRRGG